MASSSHFRRLDTFDLDYYPTTVTQYESSRTGLRVVVIDQKGPVVNGSFTLATEIQDDSGCPHTLEHLCFMGSRSYRYKGLLDSLATRACSGTNAWTDTTETNYTLVSAGWKGFSQVLPVYLEHIILPTLTDAACYTEVHHVDGAGHDAGVVYSEMQGHQNDSGCLMDIAARRLMYPKGNGLRSETGGMTDQLRVLTADQIRAFHQKMYQPKNLRLTLMGEIDHQDLLNILEAFEDTIIVDVPSFDAPFKRPWVDSTPTSLLCETKEEVVEFPDEDTSRGEILIGYLGPDYDDWLTCEAFGVLLHYLCGSSISILENTLVEKEKVCSMVSYDLKYQSKLAVWFSLSSVATENLDQVRDRFIELLRQTASKNLDMSYLNVCINRWRRQIKEGCEGPDHLLSTSVMIDHIFGQRDGRQLRQLQTLQHLEELEQWSERQWLDLLTKYLSEAHHVTVFGKPSIKLVKQLDREEKTRQNACKGRLGPSGLKDLADRLEKAQAENDRLVPDEALLKFPVPGPTSINFVTTSSARAGRARGMGRLDNDIQKIIDHDSAQQESLGKSEPDLFLHFEHIPSAFVRITIDISTTSLPLELKVFLSLWSSNFLTTRVERGGKTLTYEEVVLELEKETVACNAGKAGASPEMLCVVMQTEPERYQTVISWLETLMYHAVEDDDRLRSTLAKLTADIPQAKRDGDLMATAVNTMVHWAPESSVRAQCSLAMAAYLKHMKHLLSSQTTTFCGRYRTMCGVIHRPENLRILIVGDIGKLDRPVSAWHAFTEGISHIGPLNPLGKPAQLLSPAAQSFGETAVIVPIPAVAGSYAILTARYLDSYLHPDYPAAIVAREYLIAVEGPLWKAVRGAGLAYGSHFSTNVDAGIATFHIHQSPNVSAAFRAAREAVRLCAFGTEPLSRLMLEGAISAITLGTAESEASPAAAADASFVSQVFRDLGSDWNQRLLKLVHAVTKEQVRDAMVQYFVPMFEPSSSNLVVTCPRGMTERYLADLETVGFRPQVRKLKEFEDDYGWRSEGARSDESDDDEETTDDSDGEDGDETDESDETDDDERVNTDEA